MLVWPPKAQMHAHSYTDNQNECERCQGPLAASISYTIIYSAIGRFSPVGLWRMPGTTGCQHKLPERPWWPGPTACSIFKEHSFAFYILTDWRFWQNKNKLMKLAQMRNFHWRKNYLLFSMILTRNENQITTQNMSVKTKNYGISKHLQNFFKKKFSHKQ